MARHYTAEQKAARLAWTRAWRKRNAAKIRAWEDGYRDRRRRLARKRRKANPEKFRRQALIRARRYRAKRAAYTRQYRQQQLARNPNWARERMQAWTRKRPGYWSEVAKRRRLRLAWQKFTQTCARNRRAS